MQAIPLMCYCRTWQKGSIMKFLQKYTLVNSGKQLQGTIRKLIASAAKYASQSETTWKSWKRRLLFYNVDINIPKLECNSCVSFFLKIHVSGQLLEKLTQLNFKRLGKTDENDLRSVH